VQREEPVYESMGSYCRVRNHLWKSVEGWIRTPIETLA
jgi:hypothetical protein